MNQGNASKELLSLKSRYWCQQVVKGLGFESVETLVSSLKRGNIDLIELADIKWLDISIGDRVPQRKTLNLVEKFVPHSADLFETGPFSGMPLWKVLEGDLKVCREWISHVLKLNFDDTFDTWEIRTLKLLSLIMNDGYNLYIASDKKKLRHTPDGKNPISNIAWTYDELEQGKIHSSSKLDYSPSTIIAFFSLFHISKSIEDKNLHEVSKYAIFGLNTYAYKYKQFNNEWTKSKEVSAIECEFYDLGKLLHFFCEEFFTKKYFLYSGDFS